MKKLVVALAIVILLAGAFAAGYYLKSSASGTNAQGSKLKPPPDWTEWKYPGSEEEASSKGSSVMTNNWAIGPSFCVSLSTPDDLENVLKWYAKKFDLAGIADPTGTGSTGSFNTGDPDGNVSTSYFMTSNKPNQKNPIRTKVITQQTARYGLVVTIGRNESGSHTHILVAFFPYAFVN